jgi:hypothetical protein
LTFQELMYDRDRSTGLFRVGMSDARVKDTKVHRSA